MKNIILLLFTFLYGITAFAQVFPITNIEKRGADDKRINFVFVGDGYMENELPDYIDDVVKIEDDLFRQVPFSNYEAFFNVYAIEVPSNQSGASQSGTANGGPYTVDNYFGSTYGYQGIQRLLVPTDDLALALVLANTFPAFDQGFVLVNSEEYGGSGGPYATSSVHPSASKITIHEVGHSFAGLADEYWAGDNFAHEDHNMTKITDPVNVKWSEWIGEEGVGIYPHGTSGTAANWYRPHQSCKMRHLNYSFCPVCKERFLDKIYSLISPIENFFPATSNLDANDGPLSFSLDLILPSPNTLSVTWLLNGQPYQVDKDSIFLKQGYLDIGENRLEALVVDTTLMSKTYAPSSGYVFSVEWNIQNNPGLPIELSRFEAFPKNGQVQLEWTTAMETNNEKFIIERSNDGKSFQAIGEKRGQGESTSVTNYNFLDTRPVNGNNYYRLKQMDFGGEYEYSPIRAANFVRKFFYKIYPNPAQNTVYLQYFNSDESPLSVALTDVTGRVIKTIGQELQQGDNDLKIDISDLPSGIFFLHLHNQGYNESFKMIKN